MSAKLLTKASSLAQILITLKQIQYPLQNRLAKRKRTTLCFCKAKQTMHLDPIAHTFTECLKVPSRSQFWWSLPLPGQSREFTSMPQDGQPPSSHSHTLKVQDPLITFSRNKRRWEEISLLTVLFPSYLLTSQAFSSLSISFSIM